VATTAYAVEARLFRRRGYHDIVNETPEQLVGSVSLMPIPSPMRAREYGLHLAGK
jgi:hypothetical protein